MGAEFIAEPEPEVMGAEFIAEPEPDVMGAEFIADPDDGADMELDELVEAPPAAGAVELLPQPAAAKLSATATASVWRVRLRRAVMQVTPL